MSINKRRIYVSKKAFEMDVLWKWKQIGCLKWGFRRNRTVFPPEHYNCRCVKEVGDEIQN